MRPNFTPTQREWLHSHLPEYIVHVHRQSQTSDITSGHQFTLKVAREFLQSWPPPLENRPEITNEEDICDKVHEWFKNNNKTPQNMPMLKARADPAQSAQQLYATNDENFKHTFKSRIQDQPTSQNLPTFNRLKTEMWEKLALEEQMPWVQRAAELRDRKINGISEAEKQSNRALLEASFTQILKSYVAQTGYSFYVLGAGPPEVPGEEPPTFRMEVCPVEGLSFCNFHPTFHEHVVQPWLDYADYIEEQRILKERLHTLITTNTDGFPILPEKGPSWSVGEGSAVLTAYLDQLWYKLHGSISKHLQVPWNKLEKDPTLFLNVDDLPESCKQFRKPSKFEDADSIIDLYKFCTLRMNMEPIIQFPFILKPSPSKKDHPQLTPAQKKCQELIMLRESETDADRTSPLSGPSLNGIEGSEDENLFPDETETEHPNTIDPVISVPTCGVAFELPSRNPAVEPITSNGSTTSVEAPESSIALPFQPNSARFQPAHDSSVSIPAMSFQIQEEPHLENDSPSRKRPHPYLSTSPTDEQGPAKHGR